MGRTSTKDPASLLHSPLKLLFSLLAIQFVAETIIMFTLPVLHLRGNEAVANITDSLVLTILCAPFAWMLISGRNRAEKELRASEDSLRLIFNSAHDAIFIHGLNGDVIDVNDKMLEMFGVDREQALTLSIKGDCSSRDNPLEQLPSLWEKGREGECRLFEWKARRPNDGSQFDAEVLLSKIKLKGKEVILTTVRDITARKKAEDEVVVLSLAVEQSPSLILITDTAGMIEYANAKFFAVTGYDPAEVIGKNAADLGELPQEERGQTWDVLGSGGEWRGEYYSRKKSGESYWESASITAIKNSEGKVTNFLKIAEDISERKRIERELHKSQAELLTKHEQLMILYAQVDLAKKEWEISLDCMRDMVILADREGKVRRCNESAVRFAGKNYPEIVGRDWEELFLDPEVKSGQLYEDGVELHRSQTRQWFVLTAYPLQRADSGEVFGTVITIHDTTEMKRTAEELSSANRELKATQAKFLQQEKMASIGQLAAGVAHEINNPIGFISSNLGTLGKYAARFTGFIKAQADALAGIRPAEDLAEERKRLKIDHISADVEQLIKESLDGADRVRKIVADLKSFSRVDEAEYKYADLNECLASTLNIVWNELKYKATLNREFGEIPQVKCYPQQLNQVFMNLLVNAAHAIEKQGEITVRSWGEPGAVFVTVADTGCGIPLGQLHRIFEPFFTTKEVGKGTGLGLSISYDIVKKHNGEISVQSEVGKGTTFTVMIPVVAGR